MDYLHAPAGLGEVHICKESTASHNGSAFQVNFVERGQAFCPKSSDHFPSSGVGSGDKISVHQAIANHVTSPEAKEHATERVATYYLLPCIVLRTSMASSIIRSPKS